MSYALLVNIANKSEMTFVEVLKQVSDVCIEWNGSSTDLVLFSRSGVGSGESRLHHYRNPHSFHENGRLSHLACVHCNLLHVHDGDTGCRASREPFSLLQSQLSSTGSDHDG